MTDLIQRIEQADGPCRELDAEIRTLVGTVKMPLHAIGVSDGCFVRIVDGRIIEIGSHKDSGTSSRDFYLPRYTASIDAALTLVPEGWDWFRWSPGSMVVSKPNPNEKLFALTVEAKGATPALALCAAALRARENQHG